MPMTETQALLGQAAEECGELAQRFLKAQRFGMDERQTPDHGTNRERIIAERNDLFALLSMIELRLSLIDPADQRAMAEKRARVRVWLDYSREQGQVEG